MITGSRAKESDVCHILCHAHTGYIIAANKIGVRAGARTGYVIPGRDGNGGWRFEEILPPPPPSPSPSTPQNRFWVKIYEIWRKRQICTFKKNGIVFGEKKSPCGNTAASTQLLKIIKYSRISIIKYKIS